MLQSMLKSCSNLLFSCNHLLFSCIHLLFSCNHLLFSGTHLLIWCHLLTTKQTCNAAKHAEIVFVVFPISAKNNSPVYTLDVIMNKTTIWCHHK
jgi:hypothetical protein